MKTYIGIKAVQARPRLEPNPIEPTSFDPLGQREPREGYRVRYDDGCESWSPAEAFEEAYQELPQLFSEVLLVGHLRDTLTAVISGEDDSVLARAASPTASENDGHCPELRRLEALRMAISSPMVQYTSEAITERAAAFEAFIGGFPAATSLPYVQRMGIERDQLADRFEKLAEFMGTGTFHALAEEDQGLLIEQHSHMQGYLAVLDVRVARASGEDRVGAMVAPVLRQRIEREEGKQS